MRPSSLPTRSWIHSPGDLLTISLLAALGLAIKPMLNPISRLLLNTFLIPGGVLFGGLYMMWLTLSRGLVGKSGSATLTALIQGMAAFSLGLSPTHGLFSVTVFVLPGITVDLLFLIPGQTKLAQVGRFLLSCALANTVGIASVALIRGFSQGPLLVLLSIGFLSGSLGGLIALAVAKKLPPQLKR